MAVRVIAAPADALYDYAQSARPLMGQSMRIYLTRAALDRFLSRVKRSSEEAFAHLIRFDDDHEQGQNQDDVDAPSASGCPSSRSKVNPKRTQPSRQHSNQSGKQFVDWTDDTETSPSDAEEERAVNKANKAIRYAEWVR